MKLLTFHLSQDSFVATNGKIKEIGETYIQLDDYTFPDKEWTDFAFNIIYWWMESFTKLFTNEAKKIQCNFMDGNYRFDVEKITLKVWNVKFIAERAVDEVWQSGEVDSKQATEAIVQSAYVIAELDKKRGSNLAAENCVLRAQHLLDVMQKSLADASQ